MKIALSSAAASDTEAKNEAETLKNAIGSLHARWDKHTAVVATLKASVLDQVEQVIEAHVALYAGSTVTEMLFYLLELSCRACDGVKYVFTISYTYLYDYVMNHVKQHLTVSARSSKVPALEYIYCT